MDSANSCRRVQRHQRQPQWLSARCCFLHRRLPTQDTLKLSGPHLKPFFKQSPQTMPHKRKSKLTQPKPAPPPPYETPTSRGTKRRRQSSEAETEDRAILNRTPAVPKTPNGLMTMNSPEDQLQRGITHPIATRSGERRLLTIPPSSRSPGEWQPPWITICKAPEKTEI